MNIADWLSGILSTRGKSMAAYKRGMKKAKKGDSSGAIDDYTLAINAAETSPDVRAMALYNRALMHSGSGNDTEAASDLHIILDMKQDLPRIKTEARRRLVRIGKRRSVDTPD